MALIWMGEPIQPPLGRGDSAPEVALSTLEGRTVRLSDLSGQVVLINFWATWCKPCEDEMPAMQRLYHSLSEDNFEMLGISVDESSPDVEAFASRMGLDFPILLDPEQKTSRLYQTTGFPESILVDRNGQIVERYVGPRQWDHPDYEARIRSLMD